ncbi:hypothetical protein O3M35_012342 [Rhynocoris fuscipes]|uniref:Uncharacterized protein n=1 Tax=Rhynocoris fuscipes TaxID=488301 RepID=A0AAW1CVZ0_9HEMI
MVQCGILPYYTCPVCKVIAHPSAVTSNSCTCVFCDSYLRLDDKINTDDDMEQETGILFG